MRKYRLPIRNYEEQVYAGVLGKILGVYAGKPFEGWSRAAIEERFGEIDRYVHGELGRGIVETDDDISGTFTFLRALEDSGLYRDTPPEFFGETWLNYLIEKQTILWWGGMGISTEHTAYLRLKHGIPAPRSGSAELNGRVVSEQIGAQIFIDGCGLVAPGDPETAAELARRAAKVSHDGEAVHAAVVVAGMVSAAFVEKRMGRLLDIGVSLIPSDSLIARIHRDVRKWTKADRDWRRTFARIESKYGYQRYGGNCHVVPNHAAMVMAWAYAPDDFRRAIMIVNTAGWDTDCNSGNVGCVMGVKVGLRRICEKYDFRGPVADRMLLPTADPARGVTDAVTEALAIARMGRRVMGWPMQKPPKGGARWHFEMPGASQGWTADRQALAGTGGIKVENVAGYSAAGKRSLRVHFDALTPDNPAGISVPLMESKGAGSYAMQGVPLLYPGMTVTLRGRAGRIAGQATARLFIRYANPIPKSPDVTVYGRPVLLHSRAAFMLKMSAPATEGFPIQALGLEISARRTARGDVYIDAAYLGGRPRTEFPLHRLMARTGGNEISGFIVHADILRHPRQDQRKDTLWCGKDEGRGFLVTGTSDWRDYRFEADIAPHTPGPCGLLARWQGQKRHLALIMDRDSLKLVLRNFGETVLGSVPMRLEDGVFRRLAMEMKGGSVKAYCDDRLIISGSENGLLKGGAGIFYEAAHVGIGRVQVS